MSAGDTPLSDQQSPYLTIVATGRNDDLGGDFNGRFFRALRFNHDRLQSAGVPHEFVFVEWSPIPRQPLLATLLADEFPDLTALRSYVVDPSYHEALSLNPRLRLIRARTSASAVRAGRSS
jgi:hypothetical protein